MAIIVMEYENPDVDAVRRAGMLTAAPSKRTYSTESYSERRERDLEEAEEYRRAAIRRIGPRDKYSNNYANTSSLVGGGATNVRASLAVDRIQAQVTNELAILKHENELLKKKIDAERRAETDRKLKLRQLERNAQARKNWDEMTAGTKSLDDVLASNFAQQFGDDMEDLSITSDPIGSFLDDLPQQANIWENVFTGGVVELKEPGYNPVHTNEEHFNRIIASQRFQHWVQKKKGIISSSDIEKYVKSVMAEEERVWRNRMDNDRLEVDHKTGRVRHRAPQFRPGADF